MAGLHRCQRYSGGENVVTSNALDLLREVLSPDPTFPMLAETREPTYA